MEFKSRKKMNTNNLMVNENKKVLFFLPADKLWARTLRRGVAVFIAAGLAAAGTDFIQNSGTYIPEIWLPLLTGILAMIDKWAREVMGKK